MINIEDTFLTERQLEVYIRRKRGESLSEIANALGTSRSNICAIERKAKNNIKKALNTIKLIESLEYPVRITINAGTDLYDIPGIIYRKADERDIKIPLSGPSILRLIEDTCSHKLRNRQVLRDIVIGINERGDVTIF